MSAIEEVGEEVRTSVLCESLGVVRATLYRHRGESAPREKQPRPRHPRALLPDEREAVLGILHCDDFADHSPAEVHATLLERGRYLCSERTMYRLLTDSGEVRERRILLLELHDASGASAWSECVAGEVPNDSSETIDTAWIVISQWVAPRVLGRTFRHPGEAHDVLDRDFRGHNMAKAAVEMGLWALAATIAGEPLARFIGGIRTEIATGISLGIQASPDALTAKARAALEAGYRKVKIKIEPGRDVEWIRAVRDALGPGAHLMADANNAYTLDDADRLAALDGFGLMMIEQPLACDDLVRHAELQKRLRTPICLDESITGLDRAQDMVTLGSGRIVNIKAGRVGGLASSIAIHDFCQGNAIPVWCGGMFESSTGTSW
jgi:O-succinylbenzoate synthase